VFRGLRISSDKLIISLWALVLPVAGEHALDGYAYGLDVLNGRPALARTEEVETNYAVGVYVRVHGDLAFEAGGEGDLWGLNRIVVAELEFEAETLAFVKRIFAKDPDV